MTSSSRLAIKKMDVLRIIERRLAKPTPHFPPDESVINAIIPKTPLDNEDNQPEHVTCSDYDDWVEHALIDLTQQPARFQRDPKNSRLVECPRARLLRIGNEAEMAGTPSEFFRFLMNVTDNGRELPRVTNRALKAAQSSLDIANDFIDFVVANKKTNSSYKKLKADFRIADQIAGNDRTILKIDRALKTHGINWSAYSVANKRKGRRGKNKVS